MRYIHSHNEKNGIIFNIILIKTFFLSKVKEERRQEKNAVKLLCLQYGIILDISS